MKSAGKARSNGLYRHIRTSKEIIRNLLNDSLKYITVYAPLLMYIQANSVPYTYSNYNDFYLS